MSQRISDEYRAKFSEPESQKLTTEQITELLYSHDILALRERISKYLEQKQAVWVLFDNLDKGWSTGGVDVLDAVVLRCLIDAGRKVERDMRKSGHTFHCMVFIRNDVYEHLMQNSADYGKEMRAVLDWTDPDLLLQMLRLRLVSGLEPALHAMTLDQIWPTLCVSHYQGDETRSYIVERSLMRPRNVLKLFAHCRGFANNFSRDTIIDDDIEKGAQAYSNDLVVELDRELVDVFPMAKDLLYYFLDEKREMEGERLRKIVKNAGIEEASVEKVIDFLLYYGIIGIKVSGGDQYIYHVNYDPKFLRIRAERAGAAARYVINPAFWPALNIQ